MYLDLNTYIKQKVYDLPEDVAEVGMLVVVSEYIELVQGPVIDIGCDYSKNRKTDYKVEFDDRYL